MIGGGVRSKFWSHRLSFEKKLTTVYFKTRLQALKCVLSKRGKGIKFTKPGSSLIFLGNAPPSPDLRVREGRDAIPSLLTPMDTVDTG